MTTAAREKGGALQERLAALRHAAQSRTVEGAVDRSEVETPQPRAVVLPPRPAQAYFSSAEDRARVSMGAAGFDCETFLIQTGRQVPRLVVTGYQDARGEQRIVTGDPSDPENHVREFVAFLRTCQTQKTLIINQNIAFDFCVMAEEGARIDRMLGTDWHQTVLREIFLVLDENLVEDTMLRERLLDIAEGSLGLDWSDVTPQGNPRKKRYDLKTLANRYLGVDLDKTSWRTGYAAYLDKPLSEYPQGAVEYITSDVESALHTAARQQERAISQGLAPGQRIPNSSEQSKAAFSFALTSAWGLRTDKQKVESLTDDLDNAARRTLLVLREAGLIRADGTRDTKRTQEMVTRYYEDAGLPVPLTESGKNVSTAGSVLEDIALIRMRGTAEDVLDEKGQLDETELFKEPLYAYSQYVSIQKLVTTYLPVLRSGVEHPVNPRYETIVETGRASSFSPNIMNLPRGGTKTLLQRLQARVRECFVPRPGFILCSVDYSVAELCALAQVCIWLVGQSKLAEAINAGIDPHLLMAAEQFLHCSYEEALANKKRKDVSDMRQMAKAVNFGAPGGLGAKTFIEYAKASYNVFVTETEAKNLLQSWRNQWPEMRPYFQHINALMRGFDDKGQPVGDIEQFVSGRIRGRTRYCAAANSMFQALVADACKAACYQLSKACYLRDGPMYGARIIAMIHDETISELPEDCAHEMAHVQAKIMVDAFQAMAPDVVIRADPALMRCWYKGADPVYDAQKRLIPWEPKR